MSQYIRQNNLSRILLWLFESCFVVELVRIPLSPLLHDTILFLSMSLLQ